MSISYEEALATLQAMFAEPWTRDTLDMVLRHFQGHMENTVDAILAHGDGAPQALLDRLKSGAAQNDTALDEQLARQLAQGQNVPRQATPAAAAAAPAAKKGRGTPTTLPDDFLRIPGRTPSSNSTPASAATATSQSTLDADEALARMLQDELFSEELARNPDFAHLAGRRPGQRPAAASMQRSGMWPTGFPTAAGNRNGQQPPPMPNIMEKLSEMGNTAKARLQLMAAQFNANNNKNAADGGGAAGGYSPHRSEMRGLLDADDTADMELASRKDL